jgi:hypothetical protein
MDMEKKWIREDLKNGHHQNHVQIFGSFGA